MKYLSKRAGTLEEIESWLTMIVADYTDVQKPAITVDMCKEPYVAIIAVGDMTLTAQESAALQCA